LLTTTEETFVSAACGFLGFCTPPNENAIAVFALKVPDVNATVNTLLSMEAVPAAPEGDVKVAEVPAAQLGEPESVTMSLESDGRDRDGNSTTDSVTFEALATTEDSVTNGASRREMAPDGTPIELITSADVFTDIPYGELNCAVPSTMPVMVAMNAAVPVALPAVVSTKEDARIELQVAFKRKTLELPGAMRGELSGAKKSVGNERVILPPDGIDVEGVNLRVIATPT
jgi:hypothetical protein